MADPSLDTAAAHRWFAIETNNAVWAWLEALPTASTASPADPILHAAHASYFHWSQIGTVINQARAASLVANVHATLGSSSLATAFANECFELLDQAGDDATDWDLAFAHDSLARAYAASGRADAADQHARARAAGDAIADPEDKAVFDDWFNR